MGAFWTLVVRLSAFAGPAATLVYPLYASVKAIESPTKADDQQWLTYWVLYSFLTLFELVAGDFLGWVPLYPTIKLVLVCWLVLPQFQGAAFVYERFVRKQILGNQQQFGRRNARSHNGILELMSPDARASVAQFIDENGEEAFDRMISAATKAAKTRGNAKRESYERY
ncbi:hypothetical protein O6H91_01G154500 [Diphasiastrum complanatum]|uniref:Uncharacterized protein n=1 Tax=Diphasiastrum complanatum TaxID=34168 RepID=A0ACC2EXF1_DIPCM|nr:hypothetical protein O6H91_01G154500 [Diphasiastrum complanatum]